MMFFSLFFEEKQSPISGDPDPEVPARANSFKTDDVSEDLFTYILLISVLRISHVWLNLLYYGNKQSSVS